MIFLQASEGEIEDNPSYNILYGNFVGSGGAGLRGLESNGN